MPHLMTLFRLNIDFGTFLAEFREFWLLKFAIFPTPKEDKF